MSGTLGTGQFWICPQCRKHVPARNVACACGFSRAGLQGIALRAPHEKEEDQRPTRSVLPWVLVPACGLLLFAGIESWDRVARPEGRTRRYKFLTAQQPAQQV